MITVIIAGGSGTRLWPLSTPNYPKHLLKLNNDSRSLLQNTYERAKHLSKHIYIVPEVGHAKYVKEQLPELPETAFIIEPARRGTASCLVAALAHITNTHDLDEPIAFIWADSYVRDTEGFVHSFRLAANASKNTGRIVLIGIEPDYPATGFGYIQKDTIFDEETFVFNVRAFKEKPVHEVAKEYIKSGNYLWNCGFFIGSLNTFKKTMTTYSPGLLDGYNKLIKARSTQAYNEIYLGFENNAIDYALIEKVPNLLVAPASFDWVDLGSYEDLHKVVEKDEQGNYLHGELVQVEEVENSFIHNSEAKPLAVIGLDNVVVINTPQGLLVARKDLSQKVGDVSKRFSK